MTAYSAIIPAFNAETYISDAILSIRAQTVPPREIIVVDDGSTDRTAEVVERLGRDIRLIQQDNRGSGAATTTAIQAVTTAMIAGLDSDDIWLPHKMETQLRELEQMPKTAASFARVQLFRDGSDYNAGGPIMDGWTRTTMVIRAEVALGAGPVIDPPGHAGELVDWLARVREQGNHMHLMTKVLALRRIRPDSLTYARTAERDRGYLFAARQAILRRRNQDGRRDRCRRRRVPEHGPACCE
jgi:glycosyltransferase involved in cell wall biosynthesis